MRRLVGSIVIALLAAQPTVAATLADCGASAGQTYILEGGVVGAGQGGWMGDEISSGSIELLQDGENFDVIIGDATGGTRSSRADGAQVFLIGQPDSSLVVLVVYPSATETYRFDLQRKLVVWTQHKYAGLVDKGALFLAACK